MPSVRDRSAPFALLSRTPVHVAAIALAVALCWANSLDAPFVLDDDGWIANNPALARWSDDRGYEPATRRIPYLTFRVDYRIHGLDPSGFRLTNVGIHVLASLAVYLLARGLLALAHRGTGRTPRPWPALLAGLLFAVHPIQTQAVTYVVQRIASLAGLFYVLALALYAASRLPGVPPARARWALSGAFAAGLLASFSKETAFTLPFAILLLEAAFGEGPIARRALWAAPLLALLPVVPATVLLGGRAGLSGLDDLGALARADTALPRLAYLATQTKVVLSYVRLVLFPAGQSLEHDPAVEVSLLSPAVVASAAVLLALLGLGLALLSGRRAPGVRVAGFGILLFFLGLAVESSVIPILDVMVEHRLYLPMAGAGLVAAGASAAAAARWPGTGRWTAGAAAAALVALGWATHARNEVWRDPVALWAEAVERSPGKSRAHYNLGNALLEEGEIAAAEASWRRAVELEPGYSWAWNQLGSAALSRGDLSGAEAAYRRSVAGSRVNPEAHYNLGLVLEATGRREEALLHYREFLRKVPVGRERVAAELRARIGG